MAEAAYLLFVPDTPWYRARLAGRLAQNDAGDRQKRLAQLLPRLRPELRRQYERLVDMRRQIEAQTRQMGSVPSGMLLKLDDLLDKFLTFGLKEQEFRDYLQSLLVESRGSGPRQGLASRVPSNLPSTMPDAWIPQALSDIQAEYTRDLDALQRTLTHEADADSKAVLQKRADVLVRRQEYIGKIGKTMTNLSYQLQLVQDTFGLINDEVRARSPEQVLSDIDDVVTQTDVMAKTLDEIAPLDQMIARAG